jgi:hypothetical protein
MLLRGRVDCDAFLGENACNLLRRTGVLGRIVDVRKQRRRKRMLRSRRWTATEILTVSVHGKCGNADHDGTRIRSEPFASLVS